MMKMATFLIAACALVTAANAEIVNFSPGPYGGSKIVMPWGEYLAIPNGNSLWVGTERSGLTAKRIPLLALMA